MLSQTLLNIVMSESETQIIEWVMQDPCGYDVIERKLADYFSSQGHNNIKMQQRLKDNIRNFLSEDMSVMGW